MPRQATCLCGTCKKCKHREYMRTWYQSKTQEERRKIVTRRDPEKVKRADRNRYLRDYEKRRALIDAYWKAHPEKAVEAKKNWEARNPEKKKASQMVNNAIRDGKMERQSCWCGEKGQAHHADYSKPFDVEWLCSRHHGATRRIEA